MKKLFQFPQLVFKPIVLLVFISFASTQTVCKSRIQRCIELLYKQVNPFSYTFFVPQEAPKPLLLELIKQEKRQILAALYNFTEPDVADAIIAAFERGVDVQMITDVEGLRGKYERVTQLYNAGIPVFLYAQYRSIMHNKYFVFADTIGGNQVAWTGSANITKVGLTGNEENILVTNDPGLVEEYKEAFLNTKQRIRDAKKNKEPMRPYCAYAGNKLLVEFGKKLRSFKCF